MGSGRFESPSYGENRDNDANEEDDGWPVVALAMVNNASSPTIYNVTLLVLVCVVVTSCPLFLLVCGCACVRMWEGVVGLCIAHCVWEALVGEGKGLGLPSPGGLD